MASSSANNAKTALAYCRVWHLVDARDQVLGRLAARISTVLQGKHKPIYHPVADCGDYVVVKNAQAIVLTGKKADDKVYRYYTGYPSGLRTLPVSKVLAEKPTEVLERAVRGMLPKNKLREPRMARLKIFAGEQHPHGPNIVFNWRNRENTQNDWWSQKTR